MIPLFLALAAICLCVAFRKDLSRWLDDARGWDLLRDGSTNERMAALIPPCWRCRKRQAADGKICDQCWREVTADSFLAGCGGRSGACRAGEMIVLVVGQYRYCRECGRLRENHEVNGQGPYCAECAEAAAERSE
jgi:hypothetical protein